MIFVKWTCRNCSYGIFAVTTLAHYVLQSSWIHERLIRSLCAETSLQWWVPVTYMHHVVSISWYWSAVMYDYSCVTVFACLGFLSPNCKAPLTILFVPYAFLGMVAESVSACLHKRTGVLQWKNNVLMIAFLYPGIVFGIFFDLELVLWSYYSDEAILFTNFFWPCYFHFDTWTCYPSQNLLLTLQHFCVYLDGLVAEVLVYTDHNLLVFINHIRDNNQRLWWSFCVARVHFEN